MGPLYKWSYKLVTDVRTPISGVLKGSYLSLVFGAHILVGQS